MTDHVTEKLKEIIKTLEDGPKSKGDGTMVLVSYGVLIPTVWAVFHFKVIPWPDSQFYQIIGGIFVLTAPLILLSLIIDIKENKLVKLVAQEYYKAFPDIEDQLAANAILQRITAHGSEKTCIHKLRLKVGAITKKFICSKCGQQVKNKSFTISPVVCQNCNTELLVNIPDNCPYCDSTDVVILSPTEQVNPIQENEAKEGGAIYGGVVGMIAGQILDLIYYPFKLAFRSIIVTTKSYLYQCRKCSMTWATKLPAVKD